MTTIKLFKSVLLNCEKNFLGETGCFEQVKNSLGRNSMTYRTPCHARGHGFFHHRHVTYRMPCRASGHLVNLVVLLVSKPPRGRQFNLNVSRASCWSSKYSPGPTICLNHSNPQTLYFERFIYKVYHIIKSLLVMNTLALSF